MFWFDQQSSICNRQSTMPIKISDIFQKYMVGNGCQIVTKKEAGEEREIDLMVYKLYELTYKEVKIIEPVFEISKKEYGL